MKKAVIAVSTAVLTAGLVTASPAEAKPGPAAPKGQTTKLTEAVTVNGILKHLRQFQSIANANGGNRASGLPGYEASVNYVTRELERSGYDVTKQAFTFPFFQELSPTVLTSGGATIENSIFTYSGSGSVTGPIVPTNDVQVPPGAEAGSSNSGCEAADFDAAPAEPAIALVQRGTCEFAVKVQNAVAAGYDAVIVFNEGQPGRTDIIAGTLGVPQDVPVTGVTYEQGAAFVAAGTPTGTLTTEVEADLDRTTWNVIADLPKSKLKKIKNDDQVVVVGSHLDSVTEGPGINDNGSGSAGTLEIAKQLSKTGLDKKLQRPVRFAFWGAEELGLLGSEHYVASLDSDELSEIYANLNFDMIGSPNYARFVYDGDGSDGEAGPAGSGEIEKIFTDYFDSKRLASEPTAFDGRSDYGPFIAVGIPAGGLFSGAEGVKTPEQVELYGGTAGVAYDPCYHQACDDTTNISVKALNELGDAAAFAVASLGLSKSGLYPDGSRKAAKKITGKALAKAHGKAHGHAGAAR
ncbi:M20/M25/M40 family metallo-hydrolase [Aeromicrobium sp. 636]|uniref:M20/M25/M40 family metallo-hydrolase n=1 Tax=Aeromicrobium senzhongii TaxID=2663859 RepID=A0A8I0K1L6_9ACTN|nr:MULTISPECIES: M28 family metallopeptidase [Aeromicrobium]MBC9225024.1 M20/M25/M40 family metallo-hydrolase [Aeromicrobium senzhongii]MCQ3997135.1 M20/M25/M40 family metallo-hydrolase [Aeromicrobium sp. 636]